MSDVTTICHVTVYLYVQCFHSYHLHHQTQLCNLQSFKNIYKAYYFIWFHNHLITCMHMYRITIIWKQCIDISLWENAITANLPTVFWEIFKTKNKMQYLAAPLQPAGNLCTTQQKVNIGYIYNEILIMFPRNVFLFVFHQEGRI